MAEDWSVVRIGDPVSCGDTMAEGSGNVFANGIPVSRQVVDKTAGHGCWPPINFLEGSSNVFVNNREVLRITVDPHATHTCPPIPETHGGVVSVGSADVFAGG